MRGRGKSSLSSLDPERVHRYDELAAEASARLDEELARIRRDLELNKITVREAADQRVVVLEQHLATIRRLRAEYLEP
jgi:hypothetical protein